jgi:hypothetical protein
MQGNGVVKTDNRLSQVLAWSERTAGGGHAPTLTVHRRLWPTPREPILLNIDVN